MEPASYVKNFGGCQLGDLRLNHRALSIEIVRTGSSNLTFMAERHLSPSFLL